MAIYTGLRDKRSLGILMSNLGLTYRSQGLQDQALEHYERALSIAKDIGNTRSQCTNHSNIGAIQLFNGEPHRAIESYEAGLVLARSLQARSSECLLLGNLGEALLALGRGQEAKAKLEGAIALGDEVSPLAASAFRGTLALQLAREGNPREALPLMLLAERGIRADPEEHAKLLCKKSEVVHLAGDRNGAHETLQKAESIAAELGLFPNTELARALDHAALALTPAEGP